MRLREYKEYSVIPLAVIFVAIVIAIGRQPAANIPELQQPAPSTIPDFAAFKNVKTKKKAFFEFMLPMIRTANSEVKQEREDARAALNKIVEGRALSSENKTTLAALFTRYGLDIPES